MSDQRNTIRPLSGHPLTARHKMEIIGRMHALAEFLGAPGDWGYGTLLGDLTMQLHQVHHALETDLIERSEKGADA